jgi:hypothetical protein
MRKVLLLVTVMTLTLAPITASAAPGYYVSPIFGIASAPDGSLLVADAGQGIVKVSASGASLIAPLPGVVDVAPISGGGLWALTGGFGGPNSSTLFRVGADGSAVPVADLQSFEEKRNPHDAFIESNSFDVADLGRGEAAVADAAGNDLLLVDKHGKVKLIAVLPDELVSTANVKSLAGCPTPPNPEFAFVCGLPPMMPAEAVATSVAIGPDGAYYVGELKGFPAPTGASRVWRIEPNARNARCGESPLCSVAVDGFTSVIDLAFGPDGRLYVTQLDDASWLTVEAGVPGALGGSVHACNLATKACATVVSGVPMLTAITFRSNGSLWGVINALIPGAADVVQLLP